MFSNAQAEIPRGDPHILFDLLGGSVRAVPQDTNGKYPGEPAAITVDDIRDHLAGSVTYAFSPLTEPARGGKLPRTRVLVFDVDRRARQWQPAIAKEIEREGLAHASICTSGSDSGRCKLIVFFAKAIEARRVIRLGERILENASRGVMGIAGIAGGAKQVAVYPLRGQGGLIRIGGRNRHPERHAERPDVFFGLDGEPRVLADVIPAQRLPKADLPVIERGARHSFVERYLSRPWTYENGSRAIYRQMRRLAAEAFRLHGGTGHVTLSSWAQRIWDNSPEMHGPSPSGDRRAYRTWKRYTDNAWRHALKLGATNNRLQYIAPGEGLHIVTPGRVSAVDVLVQRLMEYAAAHGLTPDAIGIAYRKIAELLAVSATVAYRHVHTAVERKRLVIIDPGYRSRSHNASLIVGVVLPGETPESTLAKARTRGNVQRRMAYRAQHNSGARGPQAQARTPHRLTEAA